MPNPSPQQTVDLLDEIAYWRKHSIDDYREGFTDGLIRAAVLLGIEVPK